MRYSTRWFPIAIAQVLLLGSCSILSAPPDGSVRHSQNTVKSARPGSHPGKAVTTEQVFDGSYEIEPIGSLEKEGLLISYSMLVVPDRKGYLLRLSLVFRNKQNRTMIVRPKVTLTDASRKKISAYTRNGFVGLALHPAGKAQDIVSKTILGRDSNEYIPEKSRTEWADAFWLKSRYRIPADGIAIGVLVFHGTRLKEPVRLTVHSNNRKFSFATRVQLPVVGK
ncbi:MAG: hypothetical protein WCB93_06690 [Gallionella sp.]